jgi:replicative DNA helicase
MRGIFELFQAEEPVIPETINHWIDRNVFSQTHKRSMKNILKSIVSQDLPTLFDDPSEQLHEEYGLNHFEATHDMLSDTSYTVLQRAKNASERIERVIGNTDSEHETEYSKNHIQYVEAVDNGKAHEQLPVSLIITNPWLGKIFDGVMRAAPYYIGGRPGCFKTSIISEFMVDQSEQGVPGLYISGEDTKLTGGIKISAIRFSMPKWKFEKAYFEKDELDTIRGSVPKGEIYIYDRVVNRHEMYRLVHKYVKRYGIRYVVIDYLQLMEVDERNNFNYEMGRWSRDIMIASKTFQIPFLVTVQLNRDLERTKGEPKLSNIRDCGNIEQDARFVHLMFKPKNGETVKTGKMIHAVTLKDSWGGEKRFKHTFNGPIGKIENITYTSDFKKKSGEGVSLPKSDDPVADHWNQGDDQDIPF